MTARRLACYVCGERSTGGLLCRPCRRSYHVALARSVTTWSVIEWAARRARMFERRRQAAKR